MLLKPKGKISELLGYIKDGLNVSVTGLHKYARWAVFAMSEKGVLIETDYVRAREACDFLSAFTDAVFLPARSDSIGYSLERFGSNDYDRAQALAEIARGARHVVTFAEAVMQLCPSRADIAERCVSLGVGDPCDPETFASRMRAAGYRRVDQLDGKGQFAVRGDILDVSPVGSEEFYRIILDFDSVESIKLIDPERQITIKKTDRVFIAPFGEAFYTPSEGEYALARIREERAGLSADAAAHFGVLYGELELRVAAERPDVPFILPYLPRAAKFAEFVSGMPAFIGDVKQCYDHAVLVEKEHANRMEVLLASGDALPSSARQVPHTSDAFAFSSVIAFHTGISQNRFVPPDKLVELTDALLPDYSHDYDMLATDVANWSRGGYEVDLFAGSPDAVRSLTEFLGSRGVHVSFGDGGVNVIDGLLSASFLLHENKQVFIGTRSLIAKAAVRTARRRKDAMPLPTVGEYVVHTTHGVGKCLAIEKMEVGGAVHDYVVIGYAEGDKLYLPVENLDSLSRYSYSGAEPKLNRLGGGQFARIKERVRNSIREMAIDLVSLYGKRASGKGHVYAPEPALMNDFIAAFPHMDTEDQTAATRDVLNDLALGKIMDRLICGDVGFGKTEIALRAAYRVVAEGKQVAFLCPTTLLALQHYKTAVKRMESFGVRVGMLSRLSTAAETKATLEKLAGGELDLVCGTHKLLGKNIRFRDLGLLILDEEQRFGVQHKEQLKAARETVNVLTMSATPIPRTLHMSLSGIRDISMLSTPPFERLPVQTFVAEYSDGLLVDAVTREYARGGQSYIVYNRVRGIDDFAAKVRKLLPELKVSVVHGQMPPERAEKVIGEFAEGESDVLIATTIIENGIDIPRANNMVVIDSDSFGLSQMYQLRGRIGRSNRLATAYFTYDSNRQMTDVAMQRLDAIMQCKELGSGFMLAMRDLEIRGAGNILGREQHGHMEQVGYDTYMKLLREVMNEVRGTPEEDVSDHEVTVHTDYDACLPDSYVTDQEWRMRQYGNISRISSLSELRRMESTMRDIYGPPPESVVNLLAVALVKNRAAALGADEAALMHRESAITFRRAKDVPGGLPAAAEKYGGWLDVGEKVSVRFPTGKSMLRFLTSA